MARLRKTKRKAPRSRSRYFGIDIVPGVIFGFVDDETQWWLDLKRLVKPEHQVDYPPSPLATAGGQTTTFMEPLKGYSRLSIVTMPKQACDMDQTIGTLAHEAVHIFENFAIQIGEHMPSSEFRAYTMGYLVRRLLQAYIELRRPKWTTN